LTGTDGGLADQICEFGVVVGFHGIDRFKPAVCASQFCNPELQFCFKHLQTVREQNADQRLLKSNDTTNNLIIEPNNSNLRIFVKNFSTRSKLHYAVENRQTQASKLIQHI